MAAELGLDTQFIESLTFDWNGSRHNSLPPFISRSVVDEAFSKDTRVYFLIALALACFALANSMNAHAQSISAKESLLKATFIYNFIKFIDFPSEAFSDPQQPYLICVLGSDSFRDALEQTLDRKTVKGRLLSFSRLSDISDLSSCHVLYIGSSWEDKVIDILSATAASPVLSISDMDQFANSGGIIGFTKNAKKIQFQINLDAAKRARLTISSKLLSLAEIVRD